MDTTSAPQPVDLSSVELECLLMAVKAISRSQLNDGYGADCGRSRGGRRRGAIRPTATSTAVVCNGRLTFETRQTDQVLTPAKESAGNRGEKRSIALAAAAIDPGADPRHGGESLGDACALAASSGEWVNRSNEDIRSMIRASVSPTRGEPLHSFEPPST